MSFNTESPLRVAVVGGGVCGLTCAIALLKEGVDVQVYEAAAKFGEVGAGIGQGPNALRVLDTLGVLDDIRAKTEETSASAVSDGGQHHDSPKTNKWFKFLSGLPGHKLILDYDSPEAVDPGIHRAAFLDALVQHVPPERTHFHKRCTHLTVDPSDTTIHFLDGTSVTADVVLGADGIKSAVRRHLTDSYGAEVDPYLKFSKNVAYRALVPKAKADEAGVGLDFGERPLCFLGQNKHIIVFTIRGGTLLNVVATADIPDYSGPIDATGFPPASESISHDVTTDELLHTYQGWDDEVLKLLGCAEDPARWNINVVYPHLRADQWAKGCVAVLGDAAHAMLPNLGAGAGQGIEDAYLLGKLLGHPKTKRSNVEAILRAYAAVRQPRAQKVWEGSKRVADIFDSRVEYEGVHPEELRAQWDNVWRHGVDDDLDSAKEMLVADGVFGKE